jgi:DNA-binding NtrC family response regulator
VGLATEPVQRILLQLLDDRTVTRVGDERPRPVDVRFIAATNEDLEAGTRAGTFRRDLLERFGYFILRVPSLASRRDQILPIARHALAKASDEYGRASAPVLSAQVSDALLHAPWPGNIRQLVSLCRYVALNTEEGRPAMLDDLPPEFTLGQGKPPRRRVTDAAIDSALADNDGNRTKAAASLGMSREHLQRRMRRQ